MSTDTPEAETQSRDLRSVTDANLQRIGPYKILETLVEGGFGVVYLAEQTRPVHRWVALKVIKPGMDSKAVLARFEAEEQALALMDHPNVAKVFSAGTTEQGRTGRADRCVLRKRRHEPVRDVDRVRRPDDCETEVLSGQMTRPTYSPLSFSESRGGKGCQAAPALRLLRCSLGDIRCEQPRGQLLEWSCYVLE